MAPPSWTTPQQWNWLMALMPACQEASKKNRYSNWLLEISHSWFAEWPEEAVLFPDGVPSKMTPEQTQQLGVARSERTRKLARWFHNQKNKARAARSSASLPNALLAATKGTRAPQPREVFCRLFYDDEKKAIVQAELDALRASLGRKLTRSETMTHSRARVDQMYADSDEKVKAAVAERLEVEKVESMVTSDFKDVFMRRLVLYAKGLYSREERLARSLHVAPISDGTSLVDPPSELASGVAADQQDQSGPMLSVQGVTPAPSILATATSSSVQTSNGISVPANLAPRPPQALSETSSSAPGFLLARNPVGALPSTALDNLFAFSQDDEEHVYDATIFDAPFDFATGMFTAPASMAARPVDLLTISPVGAASPFASAGHSDTTASEGAAPAAGTLRTTGMGATSPLGNPAYAATLDALAPSTVFPPRGDSAQASSTVSSPRGDSAQASSTASSPGGNSAQALSTVTSPQEESAQARDAPTFDAAVEQSAPALSTATTPQGDSTQVSAAPTFDAAIEESTPTLPESTSGRPARQRKAPTRRDASLGPTSSSVKAKRKQADEPAAAEVQAPAQGKPEPAAKKGPAKRGRGRGRGRGRR
ncbi:hypothetical protein TRAPUB_6506 [Trametes pubescens]|uniref:Uncharacterized protein n=1 Tax=Trametes pubescens TaxID=154538 RepID=A0A1M2V5T2_TRAPU|nr:hypothetical protein TRAPUB_6506 [Trametes pubescens]